MWGKVSNLEVVERHTQLERCYLSKNWGVKFFTTHPLKSPPFWIFATWQNRKTLLFTCCLIRQVKVGELLFFFRKKHGINPPVFHLSIGTPFLKINGWFTYKSPFFRKENDLNQTSMMMFQPLIFQGCTFNSLKPAVFLKPLRQFTALAFSVSMDHLDAVATWRELLKAGFKEKTTST